MNTKIFLACAMVLAAGTIHAERLASGLEFQAPAGWAVKANGAGALLVPPDLTMEPGGKDPAELYLVALLPGVRDLQDPKLVSALSSQYSSTEAQVRPAGAPQPFRAQGGTGYLLRYQAVSQGVRLDLQFYVIGLPGGGVASAVGIGRPALLARREGTIALVAASLSRGSIAASSVVSEPAAGAVDAQWDQRLRGRKLYRFSGYSSSYGSGGHNSQTTLLLGSNGLYEYRRSSSVSITVPGASGGSASQNQAQGRWRIYEQDGRTFLELISSGGGTETITLTHNGTKTLLNGQQWLVGN